MGRMLILAALLGVAAAPASAEMMKCTGENIGKMTSMSSADTPAQMGMNKEISMANMEMSKGNMRGACMHYMRAQRMKTMDAGHPGMMGKM
jgi:hypothetical protein